MPWLALMLQPDIEVLILINKAIILEGKALLDVYKRQLYPSASDTMISNGQPVARSLKPGQAAAQRAQAEQANAQAVDSLVVQQLQSEVAQLKQQMHDLLALMQALQAQRGFEGDQENGL